MCFCCTCTISIVLLHSKELFMIQLCWLVVLVICFKVGQKSRCEFGGKIVISKFQVSYLWEFDFQLWLLDMCCMPWITWELNLMTDIHTAEFLGRPLVFTVFLISFARNLYTCHFTITAKQGRQRTFCQRPPSETALRNVKHLKCEFLWTFQAEA